jgi:hypothetical protein
VLTGEIVAGLLLAFGLPFASIFLRRKFLSRSGGAIELSLRLKPKSQGRGWVLGVGRFVGDDLQWFRVFSLSPRPRRTLSRRDLAVHSRRAPHGPEVFSLHKGAEVVSLTATTGPVEIAMDPSAMTGFLAWLEAQPPGATLPA